MRRSVLVLLGVLVTAATLSACSGGTPAKSSATFQTAADRPDCMPHQSRTPSATEKSGTEVAKNLAVLRYYTLRGAQPFCDGKPASRTDLQWMGLYITLGAERSHVARWLPPS